MQVKHILLEQMLIEQILFEQKSPCLEKVQNFDCIKKVGRALWH